MFLFGKIQREKESKKLKKALTDFRLPLLKIKYLSKRLDYPGFTKMFENALEILDSDLNDQDKAKQVIAKTQIFGGMGSWGDSPPYTAQTLGIRSEFDEITNQFSNARDNLKTK
ncbi:hypothetical protein ACWOCD_12210 [Enterococcus silesiacus]